MSTSEQGLDYCHCSKYGNQIQIQAVVGERWIIIHLLLLSAIFAMASAHLGIRSCGFAIATIGAHSTLAGLRSSKAARRMPPGFFPLGLPYRVQMASPIASTALIGEVSCEAENANRGNENIKDNKEQYINPKFFK